MPAIRYLCRAAPYMIALMLLIPGAVQAKGAPARVVITDFPITGAGARGLFRTNPAISGSLVVWWRWRNNGGITRGDIEGRNLATGHMFSVTTRGTVVSPPLISGTTVVWEDCRSCTVTTGGMGYLTLHHIKIFGRNLATGREFLVAGTQSARPDPALSGRFVVWHDVRQGRAGVYAKDLATGRAFPLTHPRCGQGTPSIGDSVAVWLDRRGGLLCGKNLITGHGFSVAVSTNELRFARDVKLDDHLVIWTEWNINQPHQAATIVAVDLTSGREYRVTAIPYGHFNPQFGPATALSGHVVVWEASPSAPFTNENGDIYVANLLNGRTVNITHDPHDQLAPAISGPTVVWQDLRRGYWDIYGAVLPTAVTQGALT